MGPGHQDPFNQRGRPPTGRPSPCSRTPPSGASGSSANLAKRFWDWPPERLVELHLGGKRAHGKGLVATLDHQEAVRGVFAVLRLLHESRSSTNLPCSRKVSLLDDAAGSALLRITEVGSLLPFVESISRTRKVTPSRESLFWSTLKFFLKRVHRLTSSGQRPSCRRRSSATTGILATSKL